MLVGNPSTFAIESSITQPYERPSQRALGFFVLHVGGKSYGVRSPEATLLACSFDAVRRRIARRGKHCVVFGSEPNAAKIVDAVQAAMYDEDRQGESFFGMSADELREALSSNEIVWAPDGDAAFDDGGHVLQFDQGDRVRLIAFRNTGNPDNVLRMVAEAWIGADEFYGLLDNWQSTFEAEWAAALKLATRH
ncbi:MAG: Imm42 family immunity protein [Candidatus Contendobacter sp.]|nr:Imm42 family immunity protein [Candidatus Contendobacter sp.]